MTDPVHSNMIRVTSCCVTGVGADGEGAVRLHRRGGRRAGVLRRRRHRGDGPLRPVLVEGEAAGENRLVSCQLHRHAVRRGPCTPRFACARPPACSAEDCLQVLYELESTAGRAAEDFTLRGAGRYLFSDESAPSAPFSLYK